MNDNPTTAEEQYELGKKYLGCEYIAGMTVEERKEKAVYWLTKAAEQGHVYAQYQLGENYLNGIVSPKIVELFGNKEWFSKLWKPIIDKIVRKLQNSGIA